ncbi:MAG: ActS/PrrB/RegB family redox-sensitive histidine kinase [Alphaproteobacteria bacterium]
MTSNRNAEPTPLPSFRGRVRMRTLALIRWIAVAGQLVTLLAVRYEFGFTLPIGAALAVVGISALFNLWSWSRHPARSRLSNREATFSLAFDILQLSLLLFLVGGLQNPFSLLILAPVTIAATILSLTSTLALGLLSAVCITALALWHLPLPWSDGAQLTLPILYLVGLWLALVLSIGLLAAYNWSIAEEGRRMSDALSATQAALAREQRVSALGMLAASTAHQLGSPLGTIAVVAKEIARDLPPESPLAEDVTLLLSESERCREILAGLDRNRDETGSPFAKLPIIVLIEEAAAPHGGGRVTLRYESGPAPEFPDSPMPMVAPSPEILHGLRSIIQNAVQFARSRAIVAIHWTEDEIEVTIRDDGPGFPTHILPVIGEPYISTRQGTGEHMGLGLFIAQTLLERTGAVLSFGNLRRGASVTVRWRRVALEPFDEEIAEAQEL